MPFAAGTFSLVAGNPVTTATTISSTWANNTLSDIATGLSTCLLKDGSQTVTGNIPMAGFKLSGLGAGSTAGDSIRYEQATSAVAVTGGDITGITMSQVPITVNSQSTAYGLLATDSGKFILHPTSDNSARTFTIPANASIAYTVGTVITFVNQINVLKIGRAHV